jgi:hypothetical protein
LQERLHERSWPKLGAACTVLGFAHYASSRQKL